MVRREDQNKDVGTREESDGESEGKESLEITNFRGLKRTQEKKIWMKKTEIIRNYQNKSQYSNLLIYIKN